MELKDTLIRPLVTEKTTTYLGNDRTFAFEVGVAASKGDVKRAIEDFYGVKVEAVRTAIMRGKNKRFGRHFGRRKNWKKAYVTLADGETINIFE